MEQITKLSLFVINRSKYRRLVIGKSTRDLSNDMERSSGYIGMIESPGSESKYPPHEYPAIAQALDWEIHDLLPPDESDQKSDGTLVDKVILSLGKEEDMQLVLEGMIDYGFFNEDKSIAETAKHLFIEGKAEEKVLIKVLENLTSANKLAKDGDSFKVR